MERFIDYKQLAIPETVIAFTESIQVKDNDEAVVNDQGVLEFHRQYLEFRMQMQRCRVGDFGRTAQFWVVLYLNIIEVLHMIHNAVQINDLDLRMIAWKKMLPFFFAMNKTNYSRYDSYYLRMLESIELQYPGCKELLLSAGLSVQTQDHYPNRTAIDQRGEQSINRDAKTAVGNQEILLFRKLHFEVDTKQSTSVGQYIRVNDWDQPRKFCLQITEAQRNYQVREESSENSEGFTRRIHQSIQWRAGQRSIV